MSRGDIARLTQTAEAEALVECVAEVIRSEIVTRIGEATGREMSEQIAAKVLFAVVRTYGLTRGDRGFLFDVLVEREYCEHDRNAEAGAAACAKLRSLLLALHRVVEGRPTQVVLDPFLDVMRDAEGGR